jgi:pimeloyl-ACP methyl ester carboxylesterase
MTDTRAHRTHHYLFVTASDGVDVCLRDLGGDGALLLLGHPTSFHGAVMQPLAHRLRGVRCHSFDLRAHGRSALEPSRAVEAAGFREDVLASVVSLDPERRGILGFGHSAGATAMLFAEHARPGTFRALYIYEAGLIPPGRRTPGDQSSEHFDQIRRRRRSFDSAEAAFANYASKEPLMRFTPEALSLYVDEGFAPTEDGGVELRCTPERETEASACDMPEAVFALLGEIRCPVVVAVGTAADAYGRAGYDEQVAAALPNSTLLRLPDLDHFAPQTAPDELAVSVQAFIDGECAA